ncbi:MAG: hypothetical protein J6B34_03955 [Clostridia bacterium]|nr:hypothetical protein [Clostridia bacterium]
MARLTTEQKIYERGIGYRTAHERKGINFKSSKNREIFQSGYTQGGKLIKAKPEKYPKLSKRKKG